MSKYGLGLRTIKTAVSVFVCIALAQLISYPTPLYACVAAIVCLVESPEESLKRGGIRLIGTGIGGALGLVVLWIFPGVSEALQTLVLVPLTLIAGFSVCNLLRQKNACPICGVVVLAVMLNHSTEMGIDLYALTRTLETAAGVIVAVAVNMLPMGHRENAEAQDSADGDVRREKER